MYFLIFFAKFFQAPEIYFILRRGKYKLVYYEKIFFILIVSFIFENTFENTIENTFVYIRILLLSLGT